MEGGGQGTAKNVETMSRRVTAIRGDKLSLHFWPPRANYRQFFFGAVVEGGCAADLCISFNET